MQGGWNILILRYQASKYLSRTTQPLDCSRIGVPKKVILFRPLKKSIAKKEAGQLRVNQNQAFKVHKMSAGIQSRNQQNSEFLAPHKRQQTFEAEDKNFD